jgi:hypothetical protein
VESDPFKPTEAERGKAVLILQAAELALDGGAATVEVAAALCLMRDQRVQAIGLTLRRGDRSPPR